MFNFLGEVGKLTIVAGCFNVLHHQRPTGLAAISANRATCRLVNAMVMTLLIRKYHRQFFLTVLLTKTLSNILAMSFEHLNYS